jgi:hypothetical protein
VEDEEQGTLTEHLTQESVQKAIFENIHQKRFFLAEAAPACNGKLGGLFGYSSNNHGTENPLQDLQLPRGF